MDHQNSPWARRSDGFSDGFPQQQGALANPPAAQQHQGWLGAPNGQPQQQQQQPMGAAAGSDWGGGGSSTGNLNSLDDAIDRFGVMTLRDENAVGGGVIVEHRGSGAASGADGLDMAGPRVVPEKEAGAGFGGFGQTQQHQGSPFSSSGHQQQQQQQRQHQTQQPQQPQQGFAVFPSPASAAATATGAPAPAPPAGGVAGCCPSCRGVGLEQGSPGVGGRRRGPDGAWLDDEGRRLYTEAEVREAIEQEARGWRDKAASLEASLSNMEAEAKAALRRAEQVVAEMAEQLKAAEGKTYALSVHLAQSNRPSHLA